MAKPQKPEQLPASEPGAAALPRFRVENLFCGFRAEYLHEGDVVEATEDEAAPYIGGVLTRLEDDACPT